MRLSAKAFVVDAAGRLLLLDCADPHRLEVRWWELPGGGVEPGEDEVDALVREVLEETGLVVDRAQVGPLQWTQESTFSFRSVRRFSRCHGRVVRLPEAATGSAPVLTDDEQGSILGSRWWTPAELAASTERFFPRAVPSLLPAAGRRARRRALRRVGLSGPATDGPPSPPAAGRSGTGPGCPRLGRVMTAPLERRAARVLLLDRDGRILLQQCRDPAAPSAGRWWNTTGGGIDEGESATQAAVRELHEETGLVLDPAQVGDVVHRRTTSFSFGGEAYRQSEEYFLVRTDAFDAVPTAHSELERRAVLGIRWWTRDELRGTQERVYPQELVEVLDQLGA